MDDTYVPGLNREKKQRDDFDKMNYGQQPMGTAPNAARVILPSQELPSQEDDAEAPVVGFLYSLSHKGATEWWPLHIGQNKIGKDADMDIQLCEASITGHHANINIKRMRRKGNALAASIVDTGSKNGIILNEEELDYEPHTIKNEDIVTFGLNYKCVIVLIDPTRYGLEESAEFVETAGASKAAPRAEAAPTIPVPDMADDPFAGFNDSATVNLNGTGVDLSGGSTKIL